MQRSARSGDSNGLAFARITAIRNIDLISSQAVRIQGAAPTDLNKSSFGPFADLFLLGRGVRDFSKRQAARYEFGFVSANLALEQFYKIIDGKLL